MNSEIKTEKTVCKGTVREIYEYVEIENEKIKHGLCKCYDYNGNLDAEYFYEMGIKTGNAKEYYYGELKAEGNYKNGKKDGEWKVKDYEGKIEKIIFNDGVKEKIDERYIQDKIEKSKKIELLFSLGMVAIMIICAIEIAKTI